MANFSIDTNDLVSTVLEIVRMLMEGKGRGHNPKAKAKWKRKRKRKRKGASEQSDLPRSVPLDGKAAMNYYQS